MQVTQVVMVVIAGGGGLNGLLTQYKGSIRCVLLHKKKSIKVCDGLQSFLHINRTCYA